MSFRVRFTREASEDLERLFDFVLERELSREGGDLSLPERALQAIHAGVAILKTSPFTCRKAGQSSFVRELVISFGRTGYVALFEIDGPAEVAILAVRHQLESDFH